MKKKLLLFSIALLIPATAMAASIRGSRSNVGSSGSKTADGVIKSTGGVVYAVTGITTAANGNWVLVDGDESDSATAANKYMIGGAATQFDPVSVSAPNGVLFPNGIYLDTTNVNISVIYE